MRLKSLFCCFRRLKQKNIVVEENEFQPDCPFTEEELKRGYTYIML